MLCEEKKKNGGVSLFEVKARNEIRNPAGLSYLLKLAE